MAHHHYLCNVASFNSNAETGGVVVDDFGGLSPTAWGQPNSTDSFQRLDGIVAVVGDEIVLASDIQERVIQAQIEEEMSLEDNQCGLLESMLFEKLLLHNARLDSLEVTDAEVMGEIDRRLTYYLQMFGTIEAFEAEYGKSIAEWKGGVPRSVREQILAQKMQAEIDQSVRSTPAQVQKYFEDIPVDSLPLIPEELSYDGLFRCPVVSGEAQKMRTRTTLDSIRVLVETGKMSMTLAATRYSEDPGSKYKGGCYNNIARGQFVPEFEGAVYETEIGGYSPVFESDFGFHFLRVTDRRGEQFSACHVLMKPTLTPKNLTTCKCKWTLCPSNWQRGKFHLMLRSSNTAHERKPRTKRAKSSTCEMVARDSEWMNLTQTSSSCFKTLMKGKSRHLSNSLTTTIEHIGP